MNYFIFLIACAVLLSCQSFQRLPAGNNDSSLVRFQLGSEQNTKLNFSFELLDLDSLREEKVKFYKNAAAGANIDNSIADWQSSFEKFVMEKPNGLNFKFNKLAIILSAADLKNVKDLLNTIDRDSADKLATLKKIEIISAFNEKFKDSIETTYEILTMPAMGLHYIANYTIPSHETSGRESFEIENSSFWTKRTSLEVDMRSGPATSPIVETLSKTSCDYSGPKSGFGAYPGFKIKCGGKKLKVKFGEIYSAPLNSRIYHRLGYNVPAIHHMEDLRVNYDRRYFTEFNSRKANVARVTLAGKTQMTFGKAKNYDGGSFIKELVLKDGRKIVFSEADLRKLILRNCNAEVCDYSEANINTEFESQIAELIFGPVAVVEEIGSEIGPWTYSGLNHENRRELKALLLLGAWTGNFDLRKDNNKLVWNKSEQVVKHFISDPGSGLGDQSSPIAEIDLINGMQWSLIHENVSPISESNSYPKVISTELKFKTLAKLDLFRNSSYADLKWMAVQIAELSEDEISEAIINSGLSAAEYLLLKEKLVALQKEFVEWFGLTSQYPELSRRQINTKLNFDPSGGDLNITLGNGRAYQLKARGIALVKGKLNYSNVEPRLNYPK